MQKQILLCLNLIVNSYFYFGYFGYSIDYIYFVRNFVNFFVRAIYLYNWSYMLIDFWNNLSGLEVFFQSYYYCVYSCLVGFDLFSYIERMIYLVLCAFEVYLTVLLFLSTIGNTVSVSSAIITPFLERWFTFKVWVLFIDVQYFSDFFNQVYI